MLNLFDMDAAALLESYVTDAAALLPRFSSAWQSLSYASNVALIGATPKQALAFVTKEYLLKAIKVDGVSMLTDVLDDKAPVVKTFLSKTVSAESALAQECAAHGSVWIENSSDEPMTKYLEDARKEYGSTHVAIIDGRLVKQAPFINCVMHGATSSVRPVVVLDSTQNMDTAVLMVDISVYVVFKSVLRDAKEIAATRRLFRDQPNFEALLRARKDGEALVFHTGNYERRRDTPFLFTYQTGMPDEVTHAAAVTDMDVDTAFAALTASAPAAPSMLSRVLSVCHLVPRNMVTASNMANSLNAGTTAEEREAGAALAAAVARFFE